MKLVGLVVYIKFNGEQSIWDNMIDMKHPDYTVLPENISFLKDTINKRFEYVVPLTFRTMYALREFDFIGVFKHASDEKRIMKWIRDYLLQHDIQTDKINSSYGEVGFPPNEQEADRIVHKMWGEAVYTAVKY